MKKPTKYDQFRDILRAALAAGRAAEAANPEDGGACNFDATAITLPRWRAENVERAAREAGTTCYSLKRPGGTVWIISPDTHAQANARSRNDEAVTAALRAAHWDASDWCQLD